MVGGPWAEIRPTCHRWHVSSASPARTRQGLEDDRGEDRREQREAAPRLGVSEAAGPEVHAAPPSRRGRVLCKIAMDTAVSRSGQYATVEPSSAATLCHDARNDAASSFVSPRRVGVSTYQGSSRVTRA